MSLSVIYTRGSRSLNAPLVTVEVHLANGLPSMNIVGLPEATVRESKDRVRSAIVNSGFDFPVRRITVNLAPADLPKEGGRFDLPIALGILAASNQIPTQILNNYEFVGELALSGELRFVKATLSAALASKDSGRSLVIPKSCSSEAALCKKAQIFSASCLQEVTAHLHNLKSLEFATANLNNETKSGNKNALDLADIKGQFLAKRALEIAAAGRHALLFSGSPGTGKTLLARCLATILPKLTHDEAMEVALIHSLVKQGDMPAWREPPFRAPHHTASPISLVGGGINPVPGEVSLAHNGVLFLDELPEFERRSIDMLRQPMESGEVFITRANYRNHFPAAFQLIAAMNPCPCGYYGDKLKVCRCSPDRIQKYRNKISGPMLDRIDLYMEVTRLPIADILGDQHASESSAVVRKRVENAHRVQFKRQHVLNSQLSIEQIKHHASLSRESEQQFAVYLDKLNLSARVVHRILRVSRTIADLSGAAQLQTHHWKEALRFRGFNF